MQRGDCKNLTLTHWLYTDGQGTVSINWFDECPTAWKANRNSLCVQKKSQLDTTEWFIALIICSTCFGYFYAHHQELETTCVLLPPMVCSALVAGCRRSGAGQMAMRPEWGMLHDYVVQHPSSWTHGLLPCTWPPTTSNQGTARHRR